MKSKLEKAISEAVENLFGIRSAVFSVDLPELSHGDFATNVALAISKDLGKKPSDVASELVGHLKGKQVDGVAEITIAGAGFINFKLSEEYIASAIEEASNAETWGHNNFHKGKKILVEHSSPNLFKPFHVGHFMNNAIGESINRLARYSGAEVKAISFPSDISLGIGKAIWTLMLDGDEKYNSLKTMEEKIDYLGECYVRGTKAYDEDENVQNAVKEITKKLYEKIPSKELDAFESGKKINLDYFLSVVKRLGTEFDGGFIFESEAGEEGQKIVSDNIPSIFEKSDGAVIYRGEQDGFHTRVFINQEGYPTYEAKDLGLLSLKFGRFNPDLSIFITDHQQASHFDVVLAAAKKINNDWSQKSVHRTHGRMSFKGQKMSSRLGGVPTAEAILNAVREEIRERSPDLSDESQDAITIAALKFVILRTMAGKNINFDPDASLSFEGDSGPHL